MDTIDYDYSKYPPKDRGMVIEVWMDAHARGQDPHDWTPPNGFTPDGRILMEDLTDVWYDNCFELSLREIFKLAGVTDQEIENAIKP